MDIVTTTDVFPPAYQAEDVLERLAHIGYTALDMGFDRGLEETLAYRDIPMTKIPGLRYLGGS